MFEFELSVLLFGKNRSNETLVFQVIHSRPPERKGPHPTQPVVRCSTCGGACVSGLFSTVVPNSSLGDMRMGLLIESTHMEDEGEEQENEKENEGDGGKHRVEGRRVSDQTLNQNP